MPKKKEQERAEKTFRALVENAHEGIVVYEKSGRIKFAAGIIKRLVGYHPDEIVGEKGVAFIHPDDLKKSTEGFHAILKKPNKTILIQQRLKHKSGHYFWAESRLTNFLHVPEISGVVSNFRDITESVLATEEARKSKELLETINRNLSEGIFMGILGKEFLYANEAFLTITGYKTLTALKKLKPADLYEKADKAVEIVKQLKKHATIKNEEITFRKKSGETFTGMMSASLLKHEGKADYFVGTLRDISIEKQARDAAAESTNFLNNIINTVAAPIFVKDHKHRWIILNEQSCKLIGRKREDLIGKTDKDLLNPTEAKTFWKIDNEVLRTGKTIVNEEKITNSKKQVRDILTVKSLYLNEKKQKFILGFITDITALKKVEEKINRLNANLQGVMESTNESIYAVDNKLCYTAFNTNHKRIMKALYGKDIKVGVNKLTMLQGFKDRTWIKKELNEALQGRVVMSDHFIDYDKFVGYIQTTYNPIFDGAGKVKGAAVFVKDVTERKRFEEIIKSINANLRAILESTEDQIISVDKDYRYITFNQAHAKSMWQVFDNEIKAGDSLIEKLPADYAKLAKKVIKRSLAGESRTEEATIKHLIFELSSNPIYDDHKKVKGAALFVRDITQRKQIESTLKLLNIELTEQNIQLAAQEEELKTTLEELSERNFELDQLMYKTSHDLRSPLSSIMGLVNLANLDDDVNNQRAYLAKIEGRIKKLDEFIRSMLNYARVNRTEVIHEPLDLYAIAQTCLRELEYLDNFSQVKTKITVKGKAIFKGDPLRVAIIFGNIISNAYKYYNPETTSFLQIEISLTATQVAIRFSDNGIGIRSEYMDKIFDMFYRATDRSQGSGLGMYIVKQAVEKLNGEIKIKSTYGEGTEINIIIPNQAA